MTCQRSLVPSPQEVLDASSVATDTVL